MKCSKCDFQQNEGKFCGKCGGKLVSAGETTPVMDQVASEDNVTPVQATNDHAEAQAEQEVAPSVEGHAAVPNESLEKVKETSRAYGGFFKKYIKHPSEIFTKQSGELTNGLISIGIVLLLITLTFYTLIKNAMGGFGPSFISIFSNTFLVLLVMIAVIISLLFIINKFFGTDCTFKDMVSIFGIHMTSVGVIVALGFILSLLKSNTYAILLLTIAVMLILFIIPLYIISSLLTRRSKGIDPLYGYFLYIIAVVITLTILMSILVDSTLGNMIDLIDNFMYF